MHHLRHKKSSIDIRLFIGATFLFIVAIYLISRLGVTMITRDSVNSGTSLQQQNSLPPTPTTQPPTPLPLPSTPTAPALSAQTPSLMIGLTNSPSTSTNPTPTAFNSQSHVVYSIVVAPPRDNSAALSSLKWNWYNPSGLLVKTKTVTVPRNTTQSLRLTETVDLANFKNSYGTWRLSLFVNDTLYDEQKFEYRR